jgi:anti-sigma regulatory factor (Ser/Thr protein kinase)
VIDMSGKGATPTSQLTIPAHPDAGAAARRALTVWLGGHPRLEDALLAVTELVNNAVIHGGLKDGEHLTVAMENDGDGVRLTVRHVGLPFEFASAPRPSHDPQASRGLMIVGQIADRWGVESDGTQVTAWFEVSPRLADLNGG